MSNPVAADEDAEELYLEQPNVSKEVANTICQFGSETELLHFLLQEKPEELKCGYEHYLESKALEEYMLGLCLKLNIHGYEDRGNRLKYLYSVLKSKFSQKEEVFKIVVKFLMEMSIRPTAVTHLNVDSCEYSLTPDEEDSMDEDSEKQKAILRQILNDQDDINANINYSSDSELSEWTEDDDEDDDDITEKSTNDIPPVGKIRQSSSFGEFSDLIQQPDPERLKQETQLYWMQESSKAEGFFHREIRKFDIVPLSSQPVISNLLVLQSRFGEYWEWKQLVNQKVEKQYLIAFEEDVVREILWQFVVSDPSVSPVFTSSWEVNPNLMLATLSKSSFTVLMNKYGRALKKLQELRSFAESMNKSRARRRRDNEEQTAPSKMYRCYASALQEISQQINTLVNGIERELRRTRRDAKDKSEPACTTILQLERKLRPTFDIINILYEIHSKTVITSEADSEEPWLSSIKLISCFENYLLLETRPSLYGILLYIFSRCLHALLDDIMSALRTLKWDERYSLFIRNPQVRLNDCNFWSDCIKVREYKECLDSCGISSLTCLEKLLPKVLSIIKTCEVLDQLEEDFTIILSKSNLEAGNIVDHFLAESLNLATASSNKLSPKKTSFFAVESVNTVDFLKHFEYIGLGNSYAKDAFRMLTSPNSVISTRVSQRKSYTLRDFENLTDIPFEAHSVTLEKVLVTLFTPFCVSAKENIQRIFQDYKVIDSMMVFQEIILAVREDFAKAIIEITSDKKKSEEYKYEDYLNRNPKYQKLLNECYPEGRGNFSVELKLDPSSDMNCSFVVTPFFPLNLIVTPESVTGYLFIGRQLHRIRKSLWDVSSLSMKDCKPTEGVDKTRMLMFRFCLINFCSSIRTFFTLKLFSKDFRDFTKNASYEDDLDSLRKLHEDYLESIRTRMLRNPLIENIIIRKIVVMSEVLKKKWSVGISQTTMLTLEDTLKKCWHVVNDFESTKYSFDFNELSHHFGPPPTCLSLS